MVVMLEGISFLAIVRFGALLADHTLKRSDLPGSYMRPNRMSNDRFSIITTTT